MSIHNRTRKIHDWMAKISTKIDHHSEAARLQGSVLTGSLLGGWILAGSIEIGLSPLIAASILTVGVVSGIAIRATV